MSQYSLEPSPPSRGFSRSFLVGLFLLLLFLAIVLALLFVPIYLFRSRGARGALKSLGIILGLTAVFIIFVEGVSYFMAGNWNAAYQCAAVDA